MADERGPDPFRYFQMGDTVADHIPGLKDDFERSDLEYRFELSCLFEYTWLLRHATDPFWIEVRRILAEKRFRIDRMFCLMSVLEQFGEEVSLYDPESEKFVSFDLGKRWLRKGFRCRNFDIHSPDGSRDERIELLMVSYARESHGL